MNMELEALQKEETTLLELRKLFQDQLNRLKVEELALRATIRAQQQGSEPPQPSALQLLCATQEETRRCVDDADSLNRMALQLDTMPFGNQGEQEMEEQDEEEDEEEEAAEDDYEDYGDED
ncbi:snRNA-activating protein complex subunit 5 [Petromyzon marinus]|uniref:snRNA-activating protein complex subunit 5 n=1 Tax=Petromyzon marinus TaxID=7757 RepID=A0AAJ7WP71_PETMA|nr:snRNA-activating protein complex subunit 5 [Petromyzon marinus]XP_032804835.1 snRNA-activating protein complex subunit 5 [Petromyzon marinus]XP_032804845.1 snRNA-activating protein complex subunit 5 [Petromyzon marinus]